MCLCRGRYICVYMQMYVARGSYQTSSSITLPLNFWFRYSQWTWELIWVECLKVLGSILSLPPQPWNSEYMLCLAFSMCSWDLTQVLMLGCKYLKNWIKPRMQSRCCSHVWRRIWKVDQKMVVEMEEERNVLYCQRNSLIFSHSAFSAYCWLSFFYDYE